MRLGLVILLSLQFLQVPSLAENDPEYCQTVFGHIRQTTEDPAALQKLVRRIGKFWNRKKAKTDLKTYQMLRNFALDSMKQGEILPLPEATTREWTAAVIDAATVLSVPETQQDQMIQWLNWRAENHPNRFRNASDLMFAAQEEILESWIDEFYGPLNAWHSPGTVFGFRSQAQLQERQAIRLELQTRLIPTLLASLHQHGVTTDPTQAQLQFQKQKRQQIFKSWARWGILTTLLQFIPGARFALAPPPKWDSQLGNWIHRIYWSGVIGGILFTSLAPGVDQPMAQAKTEFTTFTKTLWSNTYSAISIFIADRAPSVPKDELRVTLDDIESQIRALERDESLSEKEKTEIIERLMAARNAISR